jgi:hypothetical protein
MSVTPQEMERRWAEHQREVVQTTAILIYERTRGIPALASFVPFLTYAGVEPDFSEPTGNPLYFRLVCAVENLMQRGMKRDDILARAALLIPTP